MRWDVTQRELAREYGISQNAIGLILRRKTWRHVEDADDPAGADPSSRHVEKLVQRVRRLTDDQIAEARQLHATGVSCRAIATQLGVHHTTIMRLLTGRHWKGA
jgi:Trp operon repressor